MFKYLTCIITTCFFLPLVSHATDYPEIKTLPNGLTILVKKDTRFPIVSTRLYVKAGSTWEKEKEYGISHLLEHMVFKGTKSHPAGIDSIVENAGGTLNAYTSYDQTVYYNDMPADKWKLSLESIQGLAFDPLLKKSDLDKERQVVIAELKQRGDSPSTKLLHMATAQTLKGTVYEHPVIGTQETLKYVQPNNIKEYIKSHYDPKDMLLVVVGDINPKKIFQESNKLFASYKNKNMRSKLTPYTEEAITNLGNGFQVNIQKGKWNKTYINISFPIPDKNHADMPALQMLALLLNFDDNSLFQQEFRIDSPLVDGISINTYAFERIGLFYISAEMKSSQLPVFFEKFVRVMKNLDANDFSDKEMAQAHTAIENSFWRRGETIQDLADFYGDLYWNNPSDMLGDKWRLALENVTKEQINHVIKQYLRPEAMGLSALLPETENLDTSALKNTQSNLWQKSNTQKKDIKDATQKREILEINNKMLVLIPDTTLPFMEIYIQYLGGESLLPQLDLENEEALPSITASMLTTGTNGMDYEELTTYLSQRDIRLNASSAYLNFNISINGHKKFDDDIFKLLENVIDNPAFRKNELNRIKREQIAYVKSINDSVSSSLMVKLNGFLFKNHVYGYNRLGTDTSINAITRDDLDTFWDMQKKQNIVISVAGNFDREKVINFVNKLPAPKTTIAENTLNVANPIWNREKSFLTKVEGRNQELMLLIFPTVDRNDKDTAALHVLTTALQGFNGIIYQELREKRNLGYSAFAMKWAGEKAGYIGFGTIASPTNRETIETEFRNVAQYLRKNGITQAELERAKANIKMQYINDNQTLAHRSASVADALIFGKAPDLPQEMLAKMLKITKKDVDTVIKKYIKIDDAYWLRSGD